MYGCFDGRLVYGWNQGDRYNHIDMEDLEKEGLEMFAADVVRNHMGEAIYGLPCWINTETGQIEVDPETKTKVDALFYKIYPNYQPPKSSEDDQDENEVRLGFYLCVSGDFSLCHESIPLQSLLTKNEDQTQTTGE